MHVGLGFDPYLRLLRNDPITGHALHLPDSAVPIEVRDGPHRLQGTEDDNDGGDHNGHVPDYYHLHLPHLEVAGEIR